MSKHLRLAILRQLIMRMHNGLSCRQISKELHLNRKTVQKYQKIFKNQELSSLLNLNDEQLSTLIFSKTVLPPQTLPDKKRHVIDQLDYYKKEYSRPGVTLKLLWEEYIRDQSNCEYYSYGSFCRILRSGIKSGKTSYHKHYIPGEILMIDFAGDKVNYVDKSTGEVIECVVFVAVLPFSNYTYVEVLPNATLPYLIEALNKTLFFIQGVPVIVLTDNMAQLVTQANRYEPKFTTAAIEWANHNRTAIQACTVASPRQKSNVESHVKLTYQRLYAPLRNQIFFSLVELQRAFSQKLLEHNQRNFQGRTYSRESQFIAEELKTLRPLPKEPFIIRHFAQVKVQKNYHVMLGEDKHFYSVPVVYVGQIVQLVYDTISVEVYHKMIRIAIHQRSPIPYQYTTNKDHMPNNDKHYDQRNGYKKQDFLDKAALIGPHTAAYIEGVFQSRAYEQHAYSGCLGILRLGNEETYGPTRLEKACFIGLKLQHYSYKTILNILKTGADKRNPDEDDQDDINHDNLRGPDAF